MPARLSRSVVASASRRAPRATTFLARRHQNTDQNPSNPAASSSSTSASASSSSSKQTPSTASSSSSSSSVSYPEDGRPPILPFYPIPRAPNFPAQFTTPPGDTPAQHATINFPWPTFAPVPSDQQPKQFKGGNLKDESGKVLTAATGIPQSVMNRLRRCNVAVDYVAHMSSRGRMRRYTVYTLVGDPVKGMIGLGRGGGLDVEKARDKAFSAAVKSMDYVDRYENRTVWGQGKEMIGSFGATTVHLRARPPGFGLFVPHSVHRVLTACGIKDCSAAIHGSTHVVNVVKCVIQMLLSGANPPGLGTGFGSRGRRENKGMGMRSKTDIERARGRYGVDIGRRV